MIRSRYSTIDFAFAFVILAIAGPSKLEASGGGCGPQDAADSPAVSAAEMPAGQGDKKTKRPAQDKPKKTAQEIVAEMLAKEGITIDKKKGVVHAEGKITVTRDMLEYVAIGPTGKKHEALVTVRCKGSSLNAALLALGLRPGTNADFVEIVPRPTLEEYEAGAPLDRLILPKGPRLWLSVSWHDEKDKLVHRRVEDLILDLTTRKPMVGAKWVFTKALVAPIEKDKDPVFIADFEGNFISNFFTKPDSHFVTIVHERARDDGNWYSNTDALPARGTPCTLTLSTKPLLPGDTKVDPDEAIRKKIAEADKAWQERRKKMKAENAKKNAKKTEKSDKAKKGKNTEKAGEKKRGVKPAETRK